LTRFQLLADETWRERGFNSRSELIRCGMRDAVNHSEGSGFRKDLAISDAEFEEGAGTPDEQVNSEYGPDGE